MIYTMTNKCDLKNLSLQLYGKEVEIILVENSATHKSLTTITLKGTLVGRIWGDKTLKDGRHEDVVIAIMLRQGDNEIEIPCKDIDFLK
jgi:hypothetical protein